VETWRVKNERERTLPSSYFPLIICKNCKLKTANCKLQTANCKLQTANCKLQTANCKLQWIHSAFLKQVPQNTRLGNTNIAAAQVSEIGGDNFWWSYDRRTINLNGQNRSTVIT
jgi:hypothetical protein